MAIVGIIMINSLDLQKPQVWGAVSGGGKFLVTKRVDPKRLGHSTGEQAQACRKCMPRGLCCAIFVHCMKIVYYL